MYPAPATTKNTNNSNTIAPLTRGFLHLPRRRIAASVAAFKTCVNNNKTNAQREIVRRAVPVVGWTQASNPNPPLKTDACLSKPP